MQTGQRTPVPGHRLRTVRVAQGLGLRETARRADLDPAHLWRVETGRAGLSVESLVRLAKVLGLRDLVRSLSPFTEEP